MRGENRFALAVVSLVAFAMAACGSSSPKVASSSAPSVAPSVGPSAVASGKAHSSPTPVLNQRIDISDFAFAPNRLTIRANTTVIWYQQGKAQHTVTSGTDDTATGAAKPDGKFNSGTLKPSTTFTFTFTKAGTYAYFCSIHPKQMSALIVVQ